MRLCVLIFLSRIDEVTRGRAPIPIFFYFQSDHLLSKWFVSFCIHRFRGRNLGGYEERTWNGRVYWLSFSLSLMWLSIFCSWIHVRSSVLNLGDISFNVNTLEILLNMVTWSLTTYVKVYLECRRHFECSINVQRPTISLWKLQIH